jgi:hypothetical protein
LASLDLQIKLRNFISEVVIIPHREKLSTLLKNSYQSGLNDMKILLTNNSKKKNKKIDKNISEASLQNSYSKSKYAINEMMKRLSISQFNQDRQKTTKRSFIRNYFY